MAWRIDEQLVRAEIDNRIRGEVTGTLWFLGRKRPVTLMLKGNAWRDLAGRRIRISNPSPKPGPLDGLADEQVGQIGDMTASRKVKVPDVPVEQIMREKSSFTWHWDNCLYLEWFSEANGRVVIESVEHVVEVDGPPAWEMTEAEEQTQQEANQQAILGFMERLVEAADRQHDVDLQEERDQPTSTVEAEADAEDARQNLLMDRIMARMEREGHDEDHFERIWEEERERLRRERGEPEPEPLTPEQEAERAAWIEEMNAAAEEALKEMEEEGWEEPEDHPLVETCHELGIRLHHEVKDRHWIPDDASEEHPLYEIMHGVQFAGAKLAGALSMSMRGDPWPPEPIFAGNALVRLKKARRYLRDALSALDVADEERLADSEWRGRTRHEIRTILSHVDRLIDEVRATLEE